MNHQFPAELHFLLLKERVFHSTTKYFILVVHGRGISQESVGHIPVGWNLFNELFSYIAYTTKIEVLFILCEFSPIAYWTVNEHFLSTKRSRQGDVHPKRCTQSRSHDRKIILPCLHSPVSIPMDALMAITFQKKKLTFELLSSLNTFKTYFSGSIKGRKHVKIQLFEKDILYSTYT